MLSRNRYGINNLLIRRLHRHAKLTTLFRPLGEPLPVHSRQPQTISSHYPAGSTGIRPVQAYLVANPAPSGGQSPPLQLGRRNPAKKTSDDTDQANWQRLQAIFRAHEQKKDPAQEKQQPNTEEPVKFGEPRPLQRKAAQVERRPETPVIKSGTDRPASGPGGQDVDQELGYPSAQTTYEGPPSHQVQTAAHESETGERNEFEPGTSMATNESEARSRQSESELPPVSGIQSQPLQAAWPVQPLQAESMVKSKLEQNGEPAAELGIERETQPKDHPSKLGVDNNTLQKVMGQTPSGKPSTSSVEQISPLRPRPQPTSATEMEPLTREEDEVMESNIEEGQIFKPETDPDAIQGFGIPTEIEWAGKSQDDETANTETTVSIKDLNYGQPRSTPRSRQQTNSSAESAPKELPKGTSASMGEIPAFQQNRTLGPHAPTEPSPSHIQRQLEPPSGGGSGELGRVETSPIDAGFPPQAFIPTEVGPLPADLWDLLDQPRPSSETNVPSSVTESHINKTGIPVQRQVDANNLEDRWQTDTIPSLQPAARPVPRPPLVSSNRFESEPGRKTHPSDTASEIAGISLSSQLPDLPAVSVENIQRKPDETGGAPRPERDALSGSGSAAGHVGDINLDELARRVYAEVRARLAVEWERLRR
jgi:hypothetical protein